MPGFRGRALGQRVSVVGSICGHALLPFGAGKSLRVITGGLKACIGKLNHIGMERAPVRFTLSHANGHSPWKLFQQVFQDLVGVVS